MSWLRVPAGGEPGAGGCWRRVAAAAAVASASGVYPLSAAALNVAFALSFHCKHLEQGSGAQTALARRAHLQGQRACGSGVQDCPMAIVHLSIAREKE